MENSAMQPEDELSCIWKKKKTPKPDESFDKKYWKKIFVSSCLCAVLLDPLFLYVPILKDDIKCLMLDPKLKIVVLLLRSLIDFFYLMDIIIQIYRSENYSSLINELNPRQHWLNFNFVLKSCVPRIAKTIWASYDILIDIVALLPLPQVAILIFFSKMSDLRYLTTTRMVLMNVFALLQYVPRFLRIYLLFKEIQKMEEIRKTSIWIKGVLNFSMYIIASHVAGALWYFFAIQRMMICWHSACRKNDGCDNRMFGCHDHHFFRNTTILNDLCPVSVGDNSSDTMFFDFGIFATVLKYGIVGSTSYFKKFLNCFWWGLRNLSSFGSNLEPSADGWENLYAVFISISGLLLFLYLIGNLQVCLKTFSYVYH
ncbi:cyclic nucleotide-gated ion channel 1-like [Pyrus communis]|uniref:cyclic nucleotide-gated ion channel 1-like n=1 Tax=Pyrus communis TaxID=23211 RepID=UPI0035C19533